MRILSITAAVAALAISTNAGATPISFSVSSNADHGEAASESRSLFDAVLQSAMTAVDFMFTAGDTHDEEMILRFYREDQTCESQKQAEDETEAEAEEKKALVGPEPIYFGF